MFLLKLVLRLILGNQPTAWEALHGAHWYEYTTTIQWSALVVNIV